MRSSALFRPASEFLLPVFLCLLCVSVPAQNSVSPAPPAVGNGVEDLSSYSGEAAVLLNVATVYTYAADGSFVLERSARIRVQTEAAVRALGVISLGYAANSQTVQIVYARVRHPDGTVVESSPADAMDVPDAVTREAPFYSDLKEKQLPIRSLRAGDTLEWSARIVTTKPEAPGQFWGQESFPEDSVILSETVELRVPAAAPVIVWSPRFKAVESEIPASGAAPALHSYRWTYSQRKPTTGKAAEAEAETRKKTPLTPEQEVDEEQGKLPSVAWTNFKSWQEVGAWYRTLEQSRTAPTPEIKAKVAELTAGKTTDEEKARAIYAYVSTQIRYIGVAFGIGRYQPHSAADILGNQYGDCKDKHTLLASMLAAAGIPSDAVLIGAGIRFNPDVPSPAAFNHLITHLTLNGQQVWLDSTAEVAPYRMLYSVIRDKQALVIPSAAPAYVARTPADPPFPSTQTMEATGTLDEKGTSHSRITITLRGDTELLMRSAFHSISPGQYDQLVQRISSAMGYAGTTSNADVSRPEDTEKPFRISYDYVREKSGDWDNLKIVPQLAPVSLTRFSESDPLVRTLNLGSPRVETSTSEMKLPDGWTAVLPEASHHKCAFATYDETYRFEKGTVYTERRLEILKQKVPVADLPAYKKWADDAQLGDELYIQLVRHQSAAAPAATSAATPDLDSATDVSKLMQQAAAETQKADFSTARDLLDRAQKLSPDHIGIWALEGYLELRNGQTDKALADYQKELKLHPENYKNMYPAIVDLQASMGANEQAEDSLRAWAKADPTDSMPVSRLLSMLVADGHAKTAVTEGEAALKSFPDADKQEVLRLQLGEAYIAAGEKEKAVAILKPLLLGTDKPEILNDAAYALADASLELPLAESSTRAALAKLDAESNSWTLDEDPQILHGKSEMILATWDTLGWVLFREGKLDEAENYVRAGWLGQQNIETGKHMGDVLAARGDKAGALQAYELALAVAPPYNAMGVRIPPNEKQKQVQAQADALKQAGVKFSGDPRKMLLELRTIPLGSAAGRSGNAEYRVLLRAGKAIKVEPAGDKRIDGVDNLIGHASFVSLFPSGSGGSLVRAGVVNCYSGKCDLVLEP